MNLNQRHNPYPVSKPYDGIYAHGVEIPKLSRHLTISGQVGVSKDGYLPDTFREQTIQALTNLQTVLTSARMTFTDLVHMRFYLTDRKYISELASIREEILGGVAPAVTTFIVAGLVDENWFIEIEGIASQAENQVPDDRYAHVI